MILRYPNVASFSTPVASGLASNKNFKILSLSPNDEAISFDVNLPAPGS